MESGGSVAAKLELKGVPAAVVFALPAAPVRRAVSGKWLAGWALPSPSFSTHWRLDAATGCARAPAAVRQFLIAIRN